MNSTNYRKLFKSLFFINTLYTNVYLFIKSDDSSLGSDDKLKLESPRKMTKYYYKEKYENTQMEHFKNKIKFLEF